MSPESCPGPSFIDSEHPLTQAMEAVGLRRDLSFVPQALKHRKQAHLKSAIYLVRVHGFSEKTIVAKRSRTSSADVERTIYESVISCLPLTAPKLFGFVHEPSVDYSWLFLQYIPGVPLLLEQEQHQRAAARWLATLHALTAARETPNTLPHRGTAHYLRSLMEARQVLTRLPKSWNTGSFAEVPASVAWHLDQILADWSGIVASVAGLPESIVHGDFVSKNVRVIDREGHMEVYPFDWENAGVGLPAVDLSGIGAVPYEHAMQELAGGLSKDGVHRLALIGKLFRLIEAVQWATERLDLNWSEKSMSQLALYNVEIRTAHQRVMEG
jgi:thiamine kinase-like enzyme